MAERRVRHNGANSERGRSADMLTGVVARVLYLAVPRQLIPVEVTPPGVGTTLYRRPQRIDTRGRGRQGYDLRQPSPHSENGGRIHSDRRRGNLARRS